MQLPWKTSAKELKQPAFGFQALGKKELDMDINYNSGLELFLFHKLIELV